MITEILSKEQLCKLVGVHPDNALVTNLFKTLQANGYEIVKREFVTNRNACTCKGFYQPPNCPIHGK